jgi:poly [ADP-ribose] polymerase
VINSHDLVKRELQLLESLVDMKEAAELMKKDLRDAEQVHMLDRQFKGLGLNEMTVLDSSSVEYKELARYVVQASACVSLVRCSSCSLWLLRS